MAKADIRVLRNPHTDLTTEVFLTEAAATDIKVGEFVKLKAAGSEYVIPVADAEPVIGTTTEVVGLSAGDSNHTASADGELEVYLLQPGVVYRAPAKDPAAFDTQAEIDALRNTRVLLDLTAGVYTVDTAAVAAPANAIIITGGDADTSMVYFMVDMDAVLGS